MKILVVDDEPDVCKLIKAMVEPLGVEVRTSSNSEEAAVLVASEKFDGILLDAVMPRLDGFGLAQKIRATPPNQQAPIIMITAMDHVDAMRRAFKVGVTFFIGKPFTREKLYAIFRTARGAMLAERRRYARLPYRANVTCTLRGERFITTSVSLGEGGIGIEGSGAASVGDVLEMEFRLPEVKEPLKVTGSLRLKEPSGLSSLEFIKPSDVSREAIRDFICGKIKE